MLARSVVTQHDNGCNQAIYLIGQVGPSRILATVADLDICSGEKERIRSGSSQGASRLGVIARLAFPVAGQRSRRPADRK